MVVGLKFVTPVAPATRAWCRWSILAVACAYGALAGSAFAQRSKPGLGNLTVVAQFNGSVIEWPKPLASGPLPVSRYTGLRLQVDPRWTNTYGYRPVEVTVLSPLGAMKTDRTILMTLRAGWGRFITVQQEFVLPAGATSATTTISVPIYQTAQNYYSWDVWIDGVKDKDLCLDPNVGLSLAPAATPTAGNAATFLVTGPSKTHRLLVGTGTTDVQVMSLELSAFPTR